MKQTATPQRFSTARTVIYAALISAIPVVMSIGAAKASASAQAFTPTTKLAQTQPSQNQQRPPQPIRYNYVAQPSDSYSLLARKAVQTYGSKSKTKLSPAQIIFAETNLTQQAGSPKLSLHQKVSIEESKVKEWVEKATKLTPTQEKNWATYAQFADFNTDRVGQAK